MPHSSGMGFIQIQGSLAALRNWANCAPELLKLGLFRC